ncbi:hypothetical protein HDU77_006144 [Chytriomyces hyalinus]|nr:hypothetical protein HDU77_006144 [Chytriomyces hyalinus]
MEVGHLNPSTEPDVVAAEKPDASAGVLAGFARTAAFQGSLLVTGFGKGLLKWWFKMPVKLFRPVAVNPYMVFQHMAHGRGTTADVRFMRRVIREEGVGVVGRNFVPLLLVNSSIGAVLFNTYAGVMHTIDVSPIAEHVHGGMPIDLAPVVSGLLAGAVQSVFATPVDNLQRSLDPKAIVALRSNGGIIALVIDTLRSVLSSQPEPKPYIPLKNAHASPNHYTHRVHHLRHHVHNRVSPLKPLYHNFRITCLKDSVGFALFFGVFENMRDFGKRMVLRFQDWQGTEHHSNPIMKGVTITGPQALAVVGAGGLAGMGFQAVGYPIDRIQAEIQGRAQAGHVRESWIHAYNRIGGFREVYRGIGAQFVRVVPASAVGLFVFEMVNEYLGP